LQLPNIKRGSRSDFKENEKQIKTVHVYLYHRGSGTKITFQVDVINWRVASSTDIEFSVTLHTVSHFRRKNGHFQLHANKNLRHSWLMEAT